MSYLHRNTLEDFQEAFQYGVTLTLEELERFDKLIDKVSKQFGEESVVTQALITAREKFL